MRAVFFLLLIFIVFTGYSFILIDNKTELRLFLKNQNFTIVYGEQSPLEDQRTAEIILKQLNAIGKRAKLKDLDLRNIIVVGGPVVNSFAKDFDINNTNPGYGNGVIKTNKRKLLVAGSDRDGTMKAGIELSNLLRFIKKTEKFTPKSIDNYFLWIKNSTSRPYYYEHVRAYYTSSLSPSEITLTVFYNVTDADAQFNKYIEKLQDHNVAYNETVDGIVYRSNSERRYIWRKENIIFQVRSSQQDPFYFIYKEFSDQFFTFSKNSSK